MRKNLGRVHFNCSVLNRSEPDEVDLMVGPGDNIIENPIESTLFHAHFFNPAAKYRLEEL